jgi:DNA mismatch endonuclease (patch repair protein)
MVDSLSPTARSERMSRIRSKDTKPELSLRKALHALGFRFRLGDKKLPGKPDIVLPRYRTLIFVHGCFWHRHEGCKVANTPKSNVEFWKEKFARNVSRDSRVMTDAQALGWSVLIAWECEVNSRDKAAQTAAAMAQVIRGIALPGNSRSPSVAAGDRVLLDLPHASASVAT